MVSQKNEFCSLLVRIWLKIVRQLISTLFENIFCSKYKKTCSKWDYSRVTSGIPPEAMGLFSRGEIQFSAAILNFPEGKQPHSRGGYPRCHTSVVSLWTAFFVFWTEYIFKQCGIELSHMLCRLWNNKGVLFHEIWQYWTNFFWSKSNCL